MKGRKGKISAQIDATAVKTERSGVAVLMHWMREIIEQEQLDLGLPDVDTSGADRKSPDLVIYESRRSMQVLCLIEAKLPYFDVFNEEALKEPARSKASKRKAKFFALTNFKQLVLYDTAEVNAMKPEEEQIISRYMLSGIEDLGKLENYRRQVNTALKQFLYLLVEIHTGKEAAPRLPIDEFLIARLHEKIRVLARHYSQIVRERFHEDTKFKKELRKWFQVQNWQFVAQPSDFEKAARQTAYLLVNKILFYDLLQTKRPDELNPLEIPESLTKGSVLGSTLKGYFDEVLKIDYKTVYTTDFIDSVAFPDVKEVVVEIRSLIRILRRYDLAQLGYDVLGRIFERLIPEDERHNLGQYFTRSDIVDLILRFCVRHEDDKVLDPACGAGTFLVRAYQHKKMMNDTLKHEEILDSLYGNDIAKFPAHLATINLAIKDLGSNDNYPKILQEDFFALAVKESGFDSENLRKKYAIDLAGGKREISYPRYFDAIVGNPPYTRQEEISEMSGADREYKDSLIDKALLDITDRPLAKIGKRAGIHAYFFVHGFKFLKKGGRFGFIVSESWLDVDYGKGLQEFFLKNYKIVAIIASKVERWFSEADINTCVIILEKCDNKTERDENLCRFVYLKNPLNSFIPPAENSWAKEKQRLDRIDELIKTIEFHNQFYENDDLRIFPKSQKELWEEGIESESDGGQEDTENEKNGKYVGSKWGKYLRAPEIFFKILERGKGKFVPLREIGDVQRGFTTGANEFFYLSEEEIIRKKIEKEFWMHRNSQGHWIPNYVVKGPRECDSLVVTPDHLRNRVLIIHKRKSELKNKEIHKYLESGETKGFHKRLTCAVRENWYELTEVTADLIWIKGIWNRHFIPVAEFEPFIDQQLYAVQLKNKDWRDLVAASLNSTYFAIFQELTGRVNFGEGILWIAVYEPLQLPVLSPLIFSASVKEKVAVALKELQNRKIGTVFEEIGANILSEVSLQSVLPDRRVLDKIIMGDILGLSDEEQLEVYRAVVDLVRSRIQKAQSVEKRKKSAEGVDVEAMAEAVAKQYDEGKKK